MKFTRRSIAPLTLTLIGALAGLSACSGGGPSPSSTTAAMDAPEFPVQNRPDVRGTEGAVSAGHPLAAQAGLQVLKEGGSAVDAVVAMAGVLAVVRPHMNGIGGDAFGIFYDGDSGEVTALNGSGRSGALATPDFFRSKGLDAIPQTGALAVSVPGAVAAWVDAHERYGRLPMARLLEPAIRYARDGFPVSVRLGQDFESQGGALNGPGRALYLPGGSAPPVGSLLVNAELATTLQGVAERGKEAYYQGPVAERLAAFVESEGGHLRADDFAAHTSTWVTPLRSEYLGHTIVVMPPNTQGIAQLSYMGMAETFDLAGMGHNSADYLHTLIEVKKLAFADRDRWVADPEKADVPVERLLDDSYLQDRATQVDATRAANDPAPGFGPELEDADLDGLDDSGDTVYLTAIDADGNAVSWIQSNFAGFGSGLLEPETGVLLHNRGALYTLQDGHPNQVAPGKRPYHTLTPLMALRGEDLAFTLGTPGGDSQTQSLIAIVNAMLLFGMTPQQAIEAPRYRSYGGLRVAIEDRIPSAVRADLTSRGHDLQVVHGWTSTFGGAQMILVEPEYGTLTVASDPRREAYGLAY